MLYGLAMIIACPACATRYAVPDNAIGIDGRTVRCAKCRHAWFQEGPRQPELAIDVPPPRAATDSPAVAPAPVAPPPPPPPPPLPPEPVAPAPVAVAEPVFAPAPPPVAAPPPAPMPEPQFQGEPPLGHESARVPRMYDDVGDSRDNAPSSFAFEPPFRARRNPAKLWMAGAVAFALVVFASIGAVAYFGLPSWVPLARATFAADRPDLKLDFPPNRQERRPLPNGTDFFNVSGTITNIGQQRRAVPMLLIVLRDKHNRIVYSVEAPPPRGVLAPGESETVNQAIIDAPKSARAAEIGWKPD